MWGKESVPQPSSFTKVLFEIVYNSLNNVSVSREEMKSLASSSLGEGWILLHPGSL